MTRSLLSQAEAAFLLAPSGRSGGDCIRAALLALIAQGRIAVAKQSNPFGGYELVFGSDKGADGLLPHLRTVELTLRDRAGSGRLDRAGVLAALQKRFGYGFGRYVHEHIAPELADLGHVVRLDGKWLGIIPRTRYELTSTGQKVVAPLLRELATLDNLPALIERSPAHALQLAHTSGVMLVLSPVARRQLPRLRKLMTKDDTGFGPLVLTGSDSGSVEGFQPHAWSADSEVSSLLDGVASVCDATSADGGSDGGGGGDGGGGD